MSSAEGPDPRILARIPTLTEVVAWPDAPPAPGLDGPLSETPEPASADGAEPLGAPGTAGTTQAPTAAQALAIDSLMERLAPEIETIVRESVQESLQQAVRDAQGRVEARLRSALRAGLAAQSRSAPGQDCLPSDAPPAVASAIEGRLPSGKE